jgi:hypothetical protein
LYFGKDINNKQPYNTSVDLSDAVATILALITFTCIILSPPPTPASLNDTESVSIDPLSPQQPVAARNLSSLLTGHPLTTPLSLQEETTNTTIPTGNETTAGEDVNETLVEPDYDDDELVSLVENTSVSLMALSVQNAYALYTWDESLVGESAAALQEFATEVFADLTPLNVSDDLKEVKSSFALALKSYGAAGEAVQGDLPLNRTQVDLALKENRQGSIHLCATFEHLRSPVLHIPEEVVEIEIPAPRSCDLPAPGEEDLVLLQRYIYEDRSRANDISLMLESAEKIRTYYLFDGSGKAFVADPGRTFLLVKVKVTNLGHKGDSRIYKIRTPGLDVFRLHYRETTFSPIQLMPGTSLGEPYDATTLDRYEKKVGYILFDIPEALDLDDCSLQVDLGEAGSPTWTLGASL